MKLIWHPGTHAGAWVALGRLNSYIVEPRREGGVDVRHGFFHLGRAASVEERAKALEIEGRPEDAQVIRESFAKGGWNGYLNECVRVTYGPSVLNLSTILVELGEKEKAIDILVKAAEKGDFWLFLIKSDPYMAGLRGDSRFQELLKKFSQL